MQDGVAIVLAFLAITMPRPTIAENPPNCQVEPGAEEQGEANAGCFVVVDNRLLLVHEKYRGRFAIPGGTSIPGETAQCTAARETWEESGAEVVVGPRLHTFANGFRLFLCQWETAPETTSDRLPLPEWARNEVVDVLLLDPRRVQPDEYRFPAQLDLIRDLYESRLREDTR